MDEATAAAGALDTAIGLIVTAVAWCAAIVAWHFLRQPRVFNPDRKGTHWGRRKLARDR
ncbi:hypothetical protein SAMN05443248_3945 [Bradyrhizobium erythrophlei]|uniref:Uncharacterized protein n=1 Tax=Bradyrhizobium erythrophlei TaxID=1437360 RepID=A0A1M5QTA0_9BRAD|nr:hypothetical protein SAMN05443248_3945 [Bradyrhizobium erythrophlei]